LKRKSSGGFNSSSSTTKFSIGFSVPSGA
jgi:hypothetical protein